MSMKRNPASKVKTPRGYTIWNWDSLHGTPRFGKGEMGKIGTLLISYQCRMGIGYREPDRCGWQLAQVTTSGWRDVGGMEATPEAAAKNAPRAKKNPEEGGIPYKTWMKLIDALQRSHASGQEWVEAGRPRPSPLYDAYNAADRELLTLENEARWPYRGSAEQRKEWSYWQRHYSERGAGLKNPKKKRAR